MPAAGIEFAQVGQDVKLLKEGLGDSGKLGAAANAVQIAHDLPVGPPHGFTAEVRDEAIGFQMLKVPHELFSVEVREGPTLVRVHGTSWSQNLCIFKIVQDA
jgi:hypothetical protein